MPYLVCDPQVGVTHYKLTGPAWVPATTPAEADGSLKFDISPAEQGSNTLTVASAIADPVWGELSSIAVPFSFSRPGAPSVPANIGLTP